MRRIGEEGMRQEQQKQLLELQHQQEMQRIERMREIQEQQRQQEIQEQQRQQAARQAREEAERKLRDKAGIEQAAIDAKESARLIALELRILEKAYPNWRKITGTQGSKTAYRVWLSKQDSGYQSLLSSTNSAAVIADSIERFKADYAKPALPGR